MRRAEPEEAALPRLLLALLLLLPAQAIAQQALRIVGGPGGCFAGAIELPPQGPGFQTIRNGKSWFWDAPSTIAALELLAARTHAAGLPGLMNAATPLTAMHAGNPLVSA